MYLSVIVRKFPTVYGLVNRASCAKKYSNNQQKIIKKENLFVQISVN